MFGVEIRTNPTFTVLFILLQESATARHINIYIYIYIYAYVYVDMKRLRQS